MNDTRTVEQIVKSEKIKLAKIKRRFRLEKGKDFDLDPKGAGLVPQHIYDAYFRTSDDPDYKPLPPDHPDYLPEREEPKG